MVAVPRLAHMTQPISSQAYSPRSNGVPTALSSNLTRSMLAADPGLQHIEASLSRGGARLSDIGKLAQALDQFHAGVSKPGGDEAGNVKNVVDAVGGLETRLRELSAGGNANGPMIARIQEQIGGILGGAGAGALAGLGITRRDGVLTLDEAQLRSAIGADPDSVARVFGAPGSGLSHQLATLATQQMGKGGMLASQAADTRGDLDKLTAQKTEMTDVISRQAHMLVQQYSQTMAGGSAMFGISGDARPMSLFDMLA